MIESTLPLIAFILGMIANFRISLLEIKINRMIKEQREKIEMIRK